MTRLKFNQLIIEQPSKSFIVLDLQEKELGIVNTIEEAENLFLEVYPSFHKESVKHFIYEICKQLKLKINA